MLGVTDEFVNTSGRVWGTTLSGFFKNQKQLTKIGLSDILNSNWWLMRLGKILWDSEDPAEILF